MYWFVVCRSLAAQSMSQQGESSAFMSSTNIDQMLSLVTEQRNKLSAIMANHEVKKLMATSPVGPVTSAKKTVYPTWTRPIQSSSIGPVTSDVAHTIKKPLILGQINTASSAPPVALAHSTTSETDPDNVIIHPDGTIGYNPRPPRLRTLPRPPPSRAHLQNTPHRIEWSIQSVVKPKQKLLSLSIPPTTVVACRSRTYEQDKHDITKAEMWDIVRKNEHWEECLTGYLTQTFNRAQEV